MSDLSHQTIKNSIYGFIGFAWPMILAFVSMPLLINGLGSEKYGHYIVMNVFVSFFSLLDFGLSYTFIKKLSENSSQEIGIEIKRIFGVTIFSYAFIGLAVLFLLIAFSSLFKILINLPNEYVASYRVLFLIIGSTFLFKMLSVAVSQVPYAIRRSDISTKVSLISISFTQISSVAVVYLGFDVMALLIVQLIATISVFFAYLFINKQLLPDLKFKIIFSFDIFKIIIKNGFWVFVSNGAGSALSQLDKLVVGALCGASSVTYYSSAQMLPEKINSTAFSLSLNFFPIFSSVTSGGDMQLAGRLFRRGVLMIFIISFGLALPIVIFNYKLLNYWLGNEVASQSFLAVYYLVPTYILIALLGFCSQFLNGFGKIKFVAFMTASIALINIVFMYVLIPEYKIIGAAIAYLISVSPVPIIILYIENNYFNYSFRKSLIFYSKNLMKILSVSFLVYILFKNYIYELATNLFLVLFLAASSFVVYLTIYYIAGFFEKEDVKVFKDFGNKIFLKFTKK